MKQVITCIIASAVVAAGVAYMMPAKTGMQGAAPVQAETEAKPSLYQTIQKRGTIRCGYFEEAPFTVKDLKTGQMKGIAVELAENIAKDINMKIEWVESVNFGTLVQDLQNKRYDAICASLFVLPRGGKIDYTIPYTTVPVYGYVRPDDTRFDQGLNNVDWTSIKVAGLDGEGATTAAMKVLPNAQFMRLPQSAQIAEMLLNVAQGKADIAFVMPSVFAEFEKNNPGLLRQTKTAEPLYKFAVTFGLPPEEAGWKNTLDYMIRSYQVSGELESLLNKHDPEKYFGRL